MKPQFKHKAQTSFFMWYDHTFTNKAEAYVNKEDIKLFPQEDDRVPTGYSSYASQHKAWVADESISGAFIAKSGVFRNESGNAVSGFSIDYENGRVLFDSIQSYDYLTCDELAIKEINTYVTNETEEDLILEKQKEYENGMALYPIATGNEDPIKPYDQSVPASFLSIESTENTPFAIGGEDQTEIKAKAVVMTKTPYELDCVLGVFEDSARLTIPLLEFSDVPFDEFGDLLSDYNYADLKANKPQYFHVDRVVSSKVQDVVRKKVSPSFYVGFLDFDLTISRFPRV